MKKSLTDSLAIEFTPWKEWLGMDIDEKTLHGFNELEIISHCLHEMTFVGFDEEDIKAEMDKIEKSIEEIDNMTEEEKGEKLKSWEDIIKESGINEEHEE